MQPQRLHHTSPAPMMDAARPAPSNNWTSFMPRHRPFLRAAAAIAVLLFSLEAALQVHFRVTTGHWIVQQNPYKVDHIIPRNDKRAFSYKPNFRDPTQGLTIDQFGFRSSTTLPVPEAG